MKDEQHSVNPEQQSQYDTWEMVKHQPFCLESLNTFLDMETTKMYGY